MAMFDIKSDILEIKFTGNNIAPEIISLSELSQNIILLDRLVKPIIEQENPTIKIENSYIGLEELGNRSISLKYKIKQPKAAVISAFGILLQSIHTNDITRLPSKTINELEVVSKFNEKWGCKTEFGENINGDFKNYAGFTDNFKAEKIGTLKGIVPCMVMLNGWGAKNLL